MDCIWVLITFGYHVNIYAWRVSSGEHIYLYNREVLIKSYNKVSVDIHN